MIKNFEKYTYELTLKEKELLPGFIYGFSNKIGEHNAITNKEICQKFKERGVKMTPERVRKFVNYIRVNRLVVNLISSSKGYWIETDKKRIKEYTDSLQQRINEITKVRNSFIIDYNYGRESV